jgi:hypothetical protein
MKLDKSVQEALMDNNEKRREDGLAALLDVPMIRDSIKRHSKNDVQKGFTHTTIKVKSPEAA